ncbi:hypothetical protein HOY80DRAFT_1063184 [Tuber brumale]|nr:hypothetical protein HOY80DRAFT_1063184 [Tuber brumale]
MREFKPQLNAVKGNWLKISSKLESEEKWKNKMVIANGVSKADTNKSCSTVGMPGLVQSHGVDGMLSNGTLVNGDGVTIDKKEQIGCSKLEFKRLDVVSCYTVNYLE